MATITYNKLVRDRIPEIIEAAGKTAIRDTLEGEDYRQMVDAKLIEELAEYQESHDVEELADLLEVIYAAAQSRGCTPDALEALRREKAEARGGFARGIRLLEVDEP